MSIHSIGARLKKIREQISSATLIAVSKYHTIEEIQEAYTEGQRDFGESRVQELTEKAEYFRNKNIQDIRWHFIGRLQANKINHLLRIPNLEAIHSIDSLKLLNDLIKRTQPSPEHAKVHPKKMKIFLQVNTSHEEEKGGFRDQHELIEAIELLTSNHHFLWAGLMTMGPIRTDNFEADTREAFHSLQVLQQQLKLQYPQFPLELSMGMSSDYLMALDYGSNYLRLGSIIFGE